MREADPFGDPRAGRRVVRAWSDARARHNLQRSGCRRFLHWLLGPLGSFPRLRQLLHHFVLLYAGVILFSAAELIVGLMLMAGLYTRAAALVSIAVTPAIPTVPSCATQQFTATGTYTDGSTQIITTTVQWSSDTLAVATISNDPSTAIVASPPNAAARSSTKLTPS